MDIRTGGAHLTRYAVLHDCGRIINLMMVDGTGATLFEWMRYDDAGQPLTVTYADYLLASADVVPRIEIHHMESPAPLNPLGVKGAAESSNIGAPATIIAAIEDALAPMGVAIRELPVTPARLHRLIQTARSRTGFDPVDADGHGTSQSSACRQHGLPACFDSNRPMSGFQPVYGRLLPPAWSACSRRHDLGVISTIPNFRPCVRQAGSTRQPELQAWEYPRHRPRKAHRTRH